MAKSSSSRKPSAVKQQLAALRKKGLTRAKPKARPGGSAYATIRKLKNVLEGKAQLVKLTKEARKKYKGQFPIAGGKAIVPIHQGERISISKKTGEIHRTKRVGKRKFVFRILDGEQRLANLTGNENTIYRVTDKQGKTYSLIGRARAEEFITRYDIGAFVDSIEVVTEEMFDEEF